MRHRTAASRCARSSTPARSSPRSASRILGRTAAEDVTRSGDGKVIVKRGTLIEEPHVEAITAAGVQEVQIRSVLTCETKNGVCGDCYGRDLARGTPVNMGEAVGVIAAQSIGEPGTQLTMRTFHIGGAAQIAEQSFIESNFDGTIKIRNSNLAQNSDGDLIAMGRNMAVVIVDPDGTERAVHRIQYGARLKVDEGDKIKRGQRIAEWDPYTRPILTEVDGTVGVRGPGRRPVDVRDARRSRPASPSASSSTGAPARRAARTCGRRSSSRARTARSSSSRAAARRATCWRSTRSSRSIRARKVKAGDVIARIPTESAKTRDITGGLPRVAELFEARRPKDAAIIAEISGTVRFGKRLQEQAPHHDRAERRRTRSRSST